MTLKVLELFSGIGACSKALERLNIPHEIVDAVEIDGFAVKSFNAIHGTSFEPQDITRWDKDLDVDLIMHGSPCLTDDSLILSSRGYIPLRDVKIGDKVLTKSNTWHEVEKKFDNGVSDTLYLQGMGFENIHCTPEHKFYARHSRRVGHFGKRVIDEPEFVQAKDLIPSKHYLGIPVVQEQVEWIINDLDFWYLVGLYLGDGWLKKGKGYDVVFGLNEEKIQKVKRYVDFEKWGVSVYDEGSMQRARFANKRFYEFIEQNIGTGCFEKKMPGELLLLPNEQLKAVYQGYLDSDGCVRKDGSTIQFSSVNRNLIYSISLIINKLFKRPTRIYQVQVSPKKIIEGREVNQHDWYQLRFTLEKKNREQAFYENGYIWYQYRGCTKGEQEHVYNMQVNTDHSYIVQGCVSKNCQDFSVAGLGKGGNKGSGTRSSLMYETLRIVAKLKPKYVIWENVKNLLSAKHRPNFDAYQKTMEELGYKNFYQVLNAKHYGVPQNRERVFTVSIRNDREVAKHFSFPEPVPLEKKLKDVLEKDVDEKYYISDAMMDYFMGVNQKPSKFPRRERFLANINRKNQDVGNSVTTNAGQRPTDNFVKIITANKTGYDLAKDGDGVDLAYPKSTTRRGRVGHGVSKTIPTSNNQGVIDGFRIRKLTPLETWRLMGFDDEDFYKAEKVNSNTQLYKQAGNSIVVDVLEKILKNLIKEIQ